MGEVPGRARRYVIWDLTEDLAEARCVASFDYPLAFDNAVPYRAVQTLKHLGAQSWWTQTLDGVWCRMRRVVTFEGAAERNWHQTGQTFRREHLVGRGHDDAWKVKVDHLISFVQNYSGGDTPSLRLELNDYAKTLKSRREVPSELFRDVSQVSLIQAPVYIIALVNATMSAPEKFDSSGRARVFLPADLKQIGGTKKTEVLA